MRSEDEEDEDDFEEEVDEDEDGVDARANGYTGDEPMEYDEEEDEDEGEEDAEQDNDDEEDDDDEEEEGEDDNDNDNEDEDDEDDEDDRNTDEEGEGEDVDMNADEASQTSRESAKAKSPGFLPPPPHLVRRNLFVPSYSSAPSSLSIEAIVAIPLPCPVYSIASTTCCSYLLTGGGDGHIRAYDFWASVNGNQLMTAQQRTLVGLGEGVTKAGVARGWWTNEVDGIQAGVVSKRSEGVYSMAVEGDGLWALSGTQSGPINLYTLRHSPGQLVHSLKGHSSVVSCMSLLPHEKGLISGSWDGTVREWDLDTGQMVRQYPTHGAQISSLALRPYTPVSPTPSPVKFRDDEEQLDDGGGLGATVSVTVGPDFDAKGREANGTGGPSIKEKIDHADASPPATTIPSANGESSTDDPKPPGEDVEMAESEAGSLFDPLFDDEDADGETVPPSGNITTAPTPNINDMAPPAPSPPKSKPVSSGLALPGMPKPIKPEAASAVPSSAPSGNSTPLFNLPQPVASSSKTAASGIPVLSKTSFKAFSEDVFLTSSMDGQVVLVDRRVPDYESAKGGVGRLLPGDKAPPWCMSACWSGNGTQVLAGRRNGTIDIWDVRRTSSSTAPNLLRTLKTPTESGALSCLVGLPDGRHVATASQDNIRLWNTEEYFTPEENMGKKKNSRPPFKIIAGHHGGTISSMLVDPTSRFLITASGDRGWQGEATKVVLIHEIKR